MENFKIKTLYIELTYACNQNCLPCYVDGGIHHKVQEMTTEQIKKILKEFKEQEGRYLIITGGEPTVREDCFEILDYAEELNLPFTFASNSLLMNDQRLERLGNYKNLKLYFTSILGSTAEKHNKIACNNSFDAVLNALNYFDKKGISTYVQVTLANDYIEDMPQIAHFLMKYRQTKVKFTPIVSFGLKQMNEDSNKIIVPKTRFEKIHNIIEYLKILYPDRIEDGNILNNYQIYLLMEDYKGEALYSLSYGFLAIRPDGTKSFSCNMNNPYTFGNATESLSIQIDDRLQEYIEVLRIAEKHVLEESKQGIIEFDTAVDNKIEEIFKQRYSYEKNEENEENEELEENEFEAVL